MLYRDFQLYRRSVPLPPALFKGIQYLLFPILCRLWDTKMNQTGVGDGSVSALEELTDQWNNKPAHSRT